MRLRWKKDPEETGLARVGASPRGHTLHDGEKAVEVLRRLEWSASYSYCTGWPCCPVCRGIKPGHGKDERGIPPDNSGHRDDCELAEALAVPNAEIVRLDAAGGQSERTEG